MDKDVVLCGNRIIILIIDLLFAGLLAVTLVLYQADFQTTNRWLLLLTLHPPLLFGLLLFFDLGGLLVIYHLSEQTRVERRLRVILGATAASVNGLPLVDLSIIGAVTGILGLGGWFALASQTCSISLVGWFALILGLFVGQQVALWLYLVGR